METLLLIQTGGRAGIGFLIQFVAIVAIFWFLFFVPQRREQKRHREMLAALKPGDQVATAGGLIGEVVQIREDQVTLKSGDSRVVVERAKIARRLGATA